MKKEIKIFNKIAFILFSFVLYSSKVKSEELIEKQKVEIRSYPLSPADKISLGNSYGEMKLMTWDKQEIRIVITMISKAATSQRAEELLAGIVIQSTKNV